MISDKPARRVHVVRALNRQQELHDDDREVADPATTNAAARIDQRRQPG